MGRTNELDQHHAAFDAFLLHSGSAAQAADANFSAGIYIESTYQGSRRPTQAKLQ